MNKPVTLVAVVVAALFAGASLVGCTLLLPTNELITDCVAPEDCGPGFVCEDDACLPEDDDDGSGGSG